MPVLDKRVLDQVEAFLDNDEVGSLLPEEWRTATQTGVPTAAETAFLQSILNTIKSHPRYADLKRAPTRKETSNYLRDGYRASSDKREYIERVVKPIDRAMNALAAGMQTLTDAYAVVDSVDERDLIPMARLFAIGSELQSTVNSMVLKRGGDPSTMAAQLESAAQRFANEAATIYNPEEHTHEWYIAMKHGQSVRLCRSAGRKLTRKKYAADESDESSAASSEGLSPGAAIVSGIRVFADITRTTVRWGLYFGILVGFAVLNTLVTWASMAINWSSAHRDMVFEDARGTPGFLAVADVDWQRRYFLGWVQNLNVDLHGGLIDQTFMDLVRQTMGAEPHFRIHNPAIVDFYLGLHRILTGYSVDWLQPLASDLGVDELTITIAAPFVGAALLSVIVFVGAPMLRMLLLWIVRRTI